MACILLVAPLAGRAQINNTLEFGNINPVLDERGAVLPAGSHIDPGALVQIFSVGNNGIFPPDTNGSHNASFNSLIHTSYVGEGSVTDGLFAGLLNIDRSVANTIFARVFNRPTLAESSFYGNSQIHVTKVGADDRFTVNVPGTMIELDPNDDDSDQLSNSWEKSLGSNPLLPDSDGDGVSDFVEFLAGTGLTNGNDFLQMVEILSGDEDSLVVQWSSVPGKVYQVEYSTNPPNAELVEYFHPQDPVTAVSSETSMVFSNGIPQGLQHFRVRVLP